MRKHLIKSDEVDRLHKNTARHPMNDDVDRVVTPLGDPTGLTSIGVSFFETAPGAESTAYHFHHCEDEALYVLSGTGTAEIGGETFGIGPGDFLGYPKGGPAHILKNTGTEPLRCLVIGERHSHDVVEYPRAGKTLIRTEGQPTVYLDSSKSDT